MRARMDCEGAKVVDGRGCSSRSVDATVFVGQDAFMRTERSRRDRGRNRNGHVDGEIAALLLGRLLRTEFEAGDEEGRGDTGCCRCGLRGRQVKVKAKLVMFEKDRDG